MMLVLLRIERVGLVLEGDRWRYIYRAESCGLAGIHVDNECLRGTQC